MTGVQTCALPISSVLVEMSKKNNPYATIAQGDAENLPFEDGKFDVIFMTEALEHMLDHNKAVAEVSRVLKEDGIFIVTVPNRDWLRFDFYEKMSESWQPVDDHFFRFEEIKGILLANKLEIVKYKGSDNLYYYGTLHKFEQVIAFFLPFLYKKMKRIMFVCKAVK